MGRALLEVCCGSADDVIQAQWAGADRVELNSDLFHGGLTPTLGALIVAKRETGIQVMAMVRPREGGFCYTPAEFDTALEDAKLLLDYGADGLVFGVLQPDGTLDKGRTRVLVELCRSAGQEAVFHRAIDVVPDWREAFDALMDLGVDRVLTSGQQPTAPQGADTIREMVRYAAGRMEILPGGGINARNVNWVLEQTGCTQVHMSGHRQKRDPSAANDRGIHFGSCLYPPEDQYRMVNSSYIEEVASLLDE